MNKKRLNSLVKFLKSAGLEEADSVKALSSGPEILYIFDFDGTLFRSPAKPALWKGLPLKSPAFEQTA